MSTLFTWRCRLFICSLFKYWGMGTHNTLTRAHARTSHLIVNYSGLRTSSRLNGDEKLEKKNVHGLLALITFFQESKCEMCWKGQKQNENENSIQRTERTQTETTHFIQFYQATYSFIDFDIIDVVAAHCAHRIGIVSHIFLARLMDAVWHTK